jgi:hypothetical protein
LKFENKKCFRNMKKGRLLHNEKINNHPDIGVYGIFDTDSVLWKYYVISHSNSSMTSEICKTNRPISSDSVGLYGKRYNTKEEAIKFINEYKIKWETGSNDSLQELRDGKINEILK